MNQSERLMVPSYNGVITPINALIDGFPWVLFHPETSGEKVVTAPFLMTGFPVAQIEKHGLP